MLSLVQRQLARLAHPQVADPAYEGFLPSVQIAVFCAALLTGEALPTQVTPIASYTQMGDFDVPL